MDNVKREKLESERRKFLRALDVFTAGVDAGDHLATLAWSELVGAALIDLRMAMLALTSDVRRAVLDVEQIQPSPAELDDSARTTVRGLS